MHRFVKKFEGDKMIVSYKELVFIGIREKMYNTEIHS